MGKIKKTYSLEFKYQQGTTYKEIKERYGLDLRMFRRWVRKYRDAGLKGLKIAGGEQEKRKGS